MKDGECSMRLSERPSKQLNKEQKWLMAQSMIVLYVRFVVGNSRRMLLKDTYHVVKPLIIKGDYDFKIT